MLVFMTSGTHAIAAGIGFLGIGSEGVPTLSDYMLVVLVILLAAVAYRKLRAYPGGKPLASLMVLGMLAALSLASGNQIIKSAQATINTVFLNNPAGGTVTVNPVGTSLVTNSTAVQLRITSITPGLGETIGVPGLGQVPVCTAGSTILQPGGSCYVNVIGL